MNDFEFGMILAHVYWAALFVRTEANPLWLLAFGFVWFVFGLFCKLRGFQ